MESEVWHCLKLQKRRQTRVRFQKHPSIQAIQFWAICAITLTALRRSQLPRNAKQLLLTNHLQFSLRKYNPNQKENKGEWKERRGGRKEGGSWRWEGEIFSIFLLWRVHTKGSFWSLECWAHTCGMKSKPSVNYIKYPLPNAPHTSMCFYQFWKAP